MNRYAEEMLRRRGNRMRDGRNPYGSRGGYVTTRSPRGRRDGNDYGDDMDYSGERYDGHYNREYAPQPYAKMRGTFEYDRQYNDGNIPYDMMDYPVDGYSDGRRGVKGTGPYGIGGRLHYPRRDRASYDVNGEYDGYGDEETRLSKRDMSEWKRNLENADGTIGAHFDAQQIEQAMQTLNIQPRGFDEKALCMTANMLYSDYCDVLKQFIPKEKEVLVYTKLAKAFLIDEDASTQGDEKLAIYYYAIICDDDE